MTADTATRGPFAPGPAGTPAPPAGGGRPAARRIGPRAHLRHVSALVRRNALQIKQDPELMFDALLMPIVFVLLFVYVFGGAIAGEDNRGEYVNYVVPGLMAMMGLSLAMAVGGGVNDDARKGVMDRFRTLPIARSSVLVARVVVELGRMTVGMVILLAVGFLVGLDVRTSFAGVLAAIGLSLLFGASLVWIFILLGLSLPTPQAVQGMGFLVLMPLQFGSSIFAPTSTMPGWLETFTRYNPLSNLADAARSLITGGELARPLWMTLAWAAVITLITAPLAVSRFVRKD
jgi:oleandomycin transport system permease protein